MATNLRLRSDAAQAIRAESAQTGKSQQDIIREAVDRHLGLVPEGAPRNEAEALVADRVLLPARSRYRELNEPLLLQHGVTTQDLLDRDERL